MSGVPNSYIDDLKLIILATLNRIEQLRMRVLFGVDIIKGSYGQELQFKSDGKVYIDGVEVGDVAWNTQSFTNLLENGNFESWSAGVTSEPDGWVKTRLAANYPARSTTHKIGTYATALKWDGTVTYGFIYQPITDYVRYTSRTVTVGMWIKGGSADSVWFDINDGAIVEASSKNTGTDWEWITVTGTVGASPSRLWIVVKTSDSSNECYIDGAILVEGSVSPAFSPKPLVDDGKTIAINSATNVTTFGGNINIDGSNLIDADSIIADTATDLTLTVGTGQAFVFSKV